jgi:glycosyltransferase involved in cell wall biosynthesis/ubiquinone/menaquinone biosynthesis C-methylase UbiE
MSDPLQSTPETVRVAFVITASIFGGAAVHVADLSATLAGLGHDVRVFLGPQERLTDRLSAAGVDHVVLEHMARPIRPIRDWRAYRELRRALAEYQPSLVSTHSSKAGVLGRLAARRLGIPVLFTAHGWAFAPGIPFAPRALAWLTEWALAPLADLIICVSEYDVELARRGRFRANIVHVANGVPEVPVDRLATPECEPPVVVMVARFDPQKDQQLLLHAFAEASRTATDARLRFIGDGPGREECLALANSLGLGERVRFDGFATDVTSPLASAHLFVLASRWEGLPRTILEAFRAGLPVIASDVGGVGELVDADVGSLVPPGDQTALAEALTRFIGDRALRAQAGAKARLRYEKRYRLSRLASETLAAYETVLDAHLRGSEPPTQARVQNPGSSLYRDSHATAERARAYSRTYEAGYYAVEWATFERQFLRQVLSEHAGPNSRFLDLACGTGRVLSEAEDLFPVTVGVDISAPMLAIAKERCTRSLLVCGASEELPLNQQFDVVVLLRFFLNAEPELRLATLRTLQKVVRPGGMVIVNTHAQPLSPLGLMHRLRERHGARRPTLSSKDLSTLLSTHGFVVAAVEHYGLMPRPGRFYPRSYSAVHRRSLGISVPSPLGFLCQSALVVARRSTAR